MSEFSTLLSSFWEILSFARKKGRYTANKDVISVRCLNTETKVLLKNVHNRRTYSSILWKSRKYVIGPEGNFATIFSQQSEKYAYFSNYDWFVLILQDFNGCYSLKRCIFFPCAEIILLIALHVTTCLLVLVVNLEFNHSLTIAKVTFLGYFEVRGEDELFAPYLIYHFIQHLLLL